MPVPPIPDAVVSVAASFPGKYFLENLAARHDGSLLVTAVLTKELWYVPAPRRDREVRPRRLHTFDHLITGIAEVEPDVFVVSLCDAYTTHESHLVRIDFDGWTPGDAISPEIVYSFTDGRVRGLNGSCMLAPGVLLLADCFAGLIWRVDLKPGAREAEARVWLEHDTMANDPDNDDEIPPPPQPGINGVRFGTETGFVYYTSTAQKVFMRVAVDSDSHDPTGPVEFVASIDNCDDFCIDESAGFAYVTRHRANTLDRVPLQPRHGSEVRHVLGVPFDPTVVGPSSAVWSRVPTDHERVAYVTTDGGTTAPPEGLVRPAKVLRVDLAPRSADGGS